MQSFCFMPINILSKNHKIHMKTHVKVQYPTADYQGEHNESVRKRSAEEICENMSIGQLSGLLTCKSFSKELYRRVKSLSHNLYTSLRYHLYENVIVLKYFKELF